MASYGVSTWDANGVYNNYGIKPVSVIGYLSLENGQKSGSYSFSIPAGTKVGFAVGTPEIGSVIQYDNKRRITASGNTITISAGDANGRNDYPANKTTVIVFVEAA